MVTSSIAACGGDAVLGDPAVLPAVINDPAGIAATSSLPMTGSLPLTGSPSASAAPVTSASAAPASSAPVASPQPLPPSAPSNAAMPTASTPDTGSSTVDVEVSAPAAMAPVAQPAPVENPFAAAPACSSNQFWTRGDSGSPDMHPGLACIDCHARDGGAPDFAAAGTIFPTAHEPDDCNGVGNAVQAQVVLTDANGEMFVLDVNGVGNFFLENASLALPYTAMIATPEGVRMMFTPQTTGDCNSCHTQSGANGAPGRILQP